MSDLRVALVAEGSTDAIIIQAALKALLPRPFILTQLQPEPTRPKLGQGWSGVLRWCLDFSKRGHTRIEDDWTLPGFDLFVLHLDADVAESAYGRLSAGMAELAAQRGWPALPNTLPCPPAQNSANGVRACLVSWAALQALGPKTVLCVPSKAIEAWLAAAVLPAGHPLLSNLECNLNLAAQLANLPVAQRVKTTRHYRDREATVTDAWAAVRQLCTQADRFSTDVAAVRL